MEAKDYDVLVYNKELNEYFVETFNAANIVHAYELAVSHFVLVKKMHRENIDVISVKKVLR